MSEYVTASNGTQLDINSLVQTFTWSAGFPHTITVVYSGITYVQTITNNGTNITAISQWVAQ